MNRSFNYIGQWFLRIGLSSVFLYHGITKFFAIEGTAQMLEYEPFMVWILALAEIAGGMFILLGSFINDWVTRLGGLIISIIMIGAIFTVHIEHGWNSINMGIGNMGRGMEFQFVLLMVAIFFILVGNTSRANEIVR